eukprot:TRINITY_DN2281_c0_g2_i2.p2 TRINITY_DN2281_c0_g2~~TRINITY_DN2281_c0_g2_i2.p2  ORF type:complete len:201 (-),score=-5.66 TRINITY_DN2281_c0_g2_i2:957-1559(-)
MHNNLNVTLSEGAFSKGAYSTFPALVVEYFFLLAGKGHRQKASQVKQVFLGWGGVGPDFERCPLKSMLGPNRLVVRWAHAIVLVAQVQMSIGVSTFLNLTFNSLVIALCSQAAGVKSSILKMLFKYIVRSKHFQVQHEPNICLYIQKSRSRLFVNKNNCCEAKCKSSQKYKWHMLSLLIIINVQSLNAELTYKNIIKNET